MNSKLLAISNWDELRESCIDWYGDKKGLEVYREINKKLDKEYLNNGGDFITILINPEKTDAIAIFKLIEETENVATFEYQGTAN